jgi:hypothetical protein
MSSEKSIAKRLSGDEALESLMGEIYKRMCHHGHFHSHKAYQGYSAKVTIDFRPAMSFTPPLTDDFEVNQLDAGIEVEAGEIIEISIPIRPPNQVREENGMDLPVHVEEDGILKEKWVKPSKFRGKTKPGTPAPSRSNTSTPTVPGRTPDDMEELGVARRP